LNIWFNKTGAETLSMMTSPDLPGQPASMKFPVQLGLVINNTLVQVAAVMSKMENGKMGFTGAFTRKDMERIKEEIQCTELRSSV
jgi:hypothetical protein